MDKPFLINTFSVKNIKQKRTEIKWIYKDKIITQNIMNRVITSNQLY